MTLDIPTEAPKPLHLRPKEQIRQRFDQLVQDINAKHTSRNKSSEPEVVISLAAARLKLEYTASKKDELIRTLEKASYQDSLTGLGNDRLAEQMLFQQYSEATRTRHVFGYARGDLRRLKDINDNLGHKAGDNALCHVAESMIDSLRGSDIPCRSGGDEFKVLLPEIASQSPYMDNKESLARVGLRLSESVQRKKINIKKVEEPLHIDLGMVLGSELTQPAQLNEVSDQALYLAKKLNTKREQRVVIATVGNKNEVIFEFASKQGDQIIYEVIEQSIVESSLQEMLELNSK